MTRIKKSKQNKRRDERKTNKFKEEVNVENKFNQRTRENRKVKEERIARNREDRRDFNNQFEEVREDLIIGRNAAMEALKSNKTIEALYVTNGPKEGSINAIINLAKDKKIVIKEVDKKKLDLMAAGNVHQGVIARITPYEYFEVKDILEDAKQKNEAPFIIILDELEDPHNLGSIVRTAETCGVHGIIIPKRRNVGVTPTVYKSSAGAIEHVKIAKVTNINNTIDELKEISPSAYNEFVNVCSILENHYRDMQDIIGSEGRGISKLTLKKCDKLVKIPMIGKINSLNASVAGGIMMYEVLKGRLK